MIVRRRTRIHVQRPFWAPQMPFVSASCHAACPAVSAHPRSAAPVQQTPASREPRGRPFAWRVAYHMQTAAPARCPLLTPWRGPAGHGCGLTSTVSSQLVSPWLTQCRFTRSMKVIARRIAKMGLERPSFQTCTNIGSALARGRWSVAPGSQHAGTAA